MTYYRYYLVGFLCCKYDWLNKLLFHNKIIYALAVVAFILEFIFIQLNNYFMHFAGALSAIIILQNLFMAASDSVNKKLTWLSYIGTRTRPIYLVHYFFIPDLKPLSTPLTNIGNPFVVHLFFALIVAGLIITVTLVVERIISRNNYLNCILFGKQNIEYE